MSEDIFEYPLAAPAQAFFLCGNYLCEKSRAGYAANVANWLNVADWLNRHVLAIALHGDDEPIASVEQAADWLQSERHGRSEDGKPVHPGCILNSDYCVDSLRQLLSEMSVSHGSSFEKALIDQLQIDSLVAEFKSLLPTLILSPKQSSSDNQLRPPIDLSGPFGEPILDDLYCWSRNPPLRLPTNNSLSWDSSFLVLRRLLEGRVRAALELIGQQRGDAARLIVREIRRVREMPAIAGRLSEEKPGLKPQAETIAKNLEWLTSSTSDFVW